MGKREQNRLSARFVDTVTKSGNYIDGRGLRLRVQSNGAKSWVFRYSINGVEREMGLGPKDVLSLAQARDRAAALRLQALDRIDPKAARDAARIEAKLAEARAMTFKECAELFIKSHKGEWKNAKHASQWENTLRDYAYEVIGALPVAKIDTPLVLKVIAPIWEEKTETANRVRGRIEKILEWATVHEYRTGDNPARWRGRLEHALPKRGKAKHHAALPYTDAAAFMANLRQRSGIAYRALEFIILTAVRDSEARKARWEEIDFEAKVWTVPAERMKAKKEHKVPLSGAAMRVLRRMEEEREDEWVFPGAIKDQPISSVLKCLQTDMGRRDITVHGFRSTFRDWASEQTNFSNEVAEMALAHTIGDKVEAAYRRGDLFEKRRRLMDAWAKYCEAPKATGEVVPMQRKTA